MELLQNCDLKLNCLPFVTKQKRLRTYSGLSEDAAADSPALLITAIMPIRLF